DLPGIYSLSTYSLEEIVSRQYLVSDDVDAIINVVDASNLERNLFFTFQLLELEIPVVLAVNQMDVLRQRGMEIDLAQLEARLGIPVRPVVAVHGRGVHELLEVVIQLVGGTGKPGKRQRDLTRGTPLRFGKEVEAQVAALADAWHASRQKERGLALPYPDRFIAEKLIEGDEEFTQAISATTGGDVILERGNSAREHLESMHGEDIATIMSAEIYSTMHQLVNQVLRVKVEPRKRRTLADQLDHLTTHSVWGYVILALVLYGAYAFTFTIGDLIGSWLDLLFGTWSEAVHATFGDTNPIVLVAWDGAMGGFIGAVGGVLAYVVPFFLVIEVLQDSGYLPRAAFLLDRFMHVLGVHGKAIIPMILGFGCNVPACAGCRIMETGREKKIAIALSSLIPCAAVLVVVMGLVGRYMGPGWVAFLFAVNFGIVILVGRLLNKTMPGRCTELIMEMHEYRKPNVGVVLKQTWARTKEFVVKSIPMIIVIGVAMEIVVLFRLLDPINMVLAPVTVWWLGLPLVSGVFLVYGFLRKELTLVLLEVVASSMGLAMIDVLSPLQMLVFCMVTMLYVPCLTTV
ncbi:MAG: ferrous iron transport protein B, partial [Candidatus Lokiarchaeota archaeon]|nr:ferrous iron transport protein B [Candidatus Lokiarchaeota archaeon]